VQAQEPIASTTKTTTAKSAAQPRALSIAAIAHTLLVDMTASYYAAGSCSPASLSEIEDEAVVDHVLNERQHATPIHNEAPAIEPDIVRQV
jgi:hypothetical protein